MDCIFCKIVEGVIPSAKIYEDSYFIAILDIRPINYGHTLLIPKEHHRNVLDVPDHLAEKVYPLVRKISLAIKKGLSADGLNIIQNVEQHGGQEVFHSHIHIIPRFKDDNLKFTPRNLSYESDDVKNKIISNIKLAME
ncbi:MAG: HIT family protein [Calditerrivibrio sp.]|nr:HIT family protein [Calditerrivibrio sp.]MCA1932554.1 HIT family protein [Calditerrivibrio sp.]MCA1980057.1 HIT family protein [Calditerrivibrio sp.]